ncbi:MAG TPA: hypothetical protein VIW94_11665 [Acidimicrobiia bacterium]
MSFTLGTYQLDAATSFGPRITSLRRNGGPEILVSLDEDVKIEQAGAPYVFRGGHRLWAAPETPAVTYAPDDHDCEVITSKGSVAISAPPDRAGISKHVVVSPKGDGLAVLHRLTFGSNDADPIAPWAITQFPLGGHAIMPLIGGDTGPLPNRNLVLWPYTRVDDPRVVFRANAVIVSAVAGEKLKLGTGPNPGRLGYLRDGWLFLKTVEPGDGRPYPDLGAVGQVYVGDGFCELESVGPMSVAASGRSATLTEDWCVIQCDSIDEACEMVIGDPQ